MFPAILTAILFSISGITGSRLTRYFGSVEANLWRLSIAMCLLAIWSHKYGIGLAGTALPVFFLSGVIGFGFGDIALMQSFRRIGSRLTILIVHCLAVPIAAGIEWLWLGTRLTAVEVLAAVTILGGVSLALVPGEHIEATKREWIVGIFCGSFAAFGQGFGAVLSRKGYEITETSGYEIDGINVAYQRLIGGVLITGIVLLGSRCWPRRNRPQTMSKTPGRTAAENRNRTMIVSVLLVNALAGPGLGVACFQWALYEAPTGVVLSIIALTPLVIIPLSRYFEGEKPTFRSILGGVVAVMGVIMLYVN